MKSGLSITIDEIMKEFHPKGILSESFGEGSTVITGISAVQDCKPGDLIFIDKKEYLPLVETRHPTAVVISIELKNLLAPVKNTTIIIAPNLALAHALLKGKYGSRDFSSSGWSGIHLSAVIHETVIIGRDTVIEPKSIIGKNVKIGSGSRIMAGVVIENDAIIGDSTIIHPNSVIGYGCHIGNNVVICAGSVIGSEGYGFAQDRERKSHPIPQTGIVVIEDRVRVGANNCIDRATYGVTRIGAGTKLDNLCHIAHNVEVGKDCLLTAFLCIAGSTKLGDRVIASGNTGFLDHVTVCSDTVFLHRAGISKDIDKPGMYAGSPVQPFKDYMKNTAVLRTATELRKRISDLEQKTNKDS